MKDEITATGVNGTWLCDGIQLRPRLLVPAWLGNCLLWLFFHRRDTSTSVTLSGLYDPVKDGPVFRDNVVSVANTQCPKCGATEFEMRNYEMAWHEGDIHCAGCGEYIRRFDAG